MDKCFITATIVFAFVVAILTTGFIVRYEDKLGDYESRISSLEKELSGVYRFFEEEYGPVHVSEKDFEYEIPAHPNLFGSDENSSEDYVSKEQEEKKETGTTAHSQEDKEHHGTWNQNQHRQRHTTGAGGDINIVKAEAWVETPGKPVAAHYVADVSNFTTAHPHYKGNGRLRNADGIFEAWKPSEWMESGSASVTATAAGENKNFVMNQNGVLTIKKPGLYYIYAQIHYLDEHDINGYVVQVNTTPFIQCTTMTETHSGGSKSNSCFTAGITHLKENDRVLIKDIETNRYSIFKPEKSFFGLMKIGDVN